MSFDGSGVYSLTYTWATEAASPPIAISKLDTEMAGIATGLSLCVLRNGNGVPTADTPWNDKKITGLADATLATDALNRQTADARYGVPTSGDFTLNIRVATSGGTVVCSGTAYWIKRDDIVFLRLPEWGAHSGTTETAIFLEGLPADIQPSGMTGTIVQYIPIILVDSDGVGAGYASLSEGVGYMQLYKGWQGVWTGSNATKGPVKNQVVMWRTSD